MTPKSVNLPQISTFLRKVWLFFSKVTFLCVWYWYWFETDLIFILMLILKKQGFFLWGHLLGGFIWVTRYTMTSTWLLIRSSRWITFSDCISRTRIIWFTTCSDGKIIKRWTAADIVSFHSWVWCCAISFFFFKFCLNRNKCKTVRSVNDDFTEGRGHSRVRQNLKSNFLWEDLWGSFWGGPWGAPRERGRDLWGHPW